MSDSEINPQVLVVMVPFPAQGHLNQLLHLSHLISSYGLPVHYTGSAVHNLQAKLRFQGWQLEGDSSGDKIHFHDVELPPYDSPPPDPNPSMHFPTHLQPLWNASMQLREPVSDLLRQLSSEFRRIIVIYDSLMSYVVQGVGDIPNAESYKFVPFCAFTVFFNLWDSLNRTLPFELDSNVIPKCNIPTNEGCFTLEMQKFLAEKVHKFSGMENGNLYNTSRMIDGTYVELLERLSSKKCFTIGPFNPVEIAKPESQRHECLQWLDKQEKDSVIYISFGTLTSITNEEIEEIAIGLEKSGQKFLWVLRDADKGNGFTSDDAAHRMKLPEGYEERVEDRGIVVREWSPQLEILAHSSTGGFLSHCGWNSCIESISMGVAMATWPMHSDQPRNAILVTEVLRIGTVVREWARRGEMVSSGEVERAVKRLMATEEGAEMRERAAQLSEVVRGSVSGSGGSRLEMDSFVDHITR